MTRSPASLRRRSRAGPRVIELTKNCLSEMNFSEVTFVAASVAKGYRMVCGVIGRPGARSHRSDDFTDLTIAYVYAKAAA